MIKATLIPLMCIAMTLIANAQTSESLSNKIDRIYEIYTKNTPGCAVAIVRNDSLIFSKGYGMASLPYNVPISVETTFQIGSVSKQFTAYCILRLARDGKLSVTDKVRKYLPWLPEMCSTITIYELLHHTSGIRESTLYGPDMEINAHDELKKALVRQTTLNYEPGTRESYCNTGFNLLALVVKNASGKTLREYADSVIFRPLHMEHTYFSDVHDEVIACLAEGYMPVNGRYLRANERGSEIVGGSGMVSTVTDMAKWLKYLCHPPKADEGLIDEMFRKGKLNDGQEFPYGAGIVVQPLNGRQSFNHTGKIAGYNAFMAVFPAERTGFVFLSNVFDYSVNATAIPVISLLLPDATDKRPIAIDTLAAKLKGTSAVRRFAGDYLSPDGTALTLSLRNGLVYLDISGQHALLQPKGSGNYFIPAFKLGLKLEGTGKGRYVVLDAINFFYPKAKTPIPVTDQQLSAYTGHYYCKENDFAFDIVLCDHKLKLINSRYDDADISFVNADEVFDSNWWMDHLTMLRNPAGKITGFEVNVRSTYHLRYDKLSQ